MASALNSCASSYALFSGSEPENTLAVPDRTRELVRAALEQEQVACMALQEWVTLVTDAWQAHRASERPTMTAWQQVWVEEREHSEAPKLTIATRRELVPVLAAERMSQHAMAAVLGVSQSAVSQLGGATNKELISGADGREVRGVLEDGAGVVHRSSVDAHIPCQLAVTSGAN